MNHEYQEEQVLHCTIIDDQSDPGFSRPARGQRPAYHWYQHGERSHGHSSDPSPSPDEIDISGRSYLEGGSHHEHNTPDRNRPFTRNGIGDGTSHDGTHEGTDTRNGSQKPGNGRSTFCYLYQALANGESHSPELQD
jgi:hypothetical protein